MKDKLIAALRARHAGLSNSLYESLATELAAGVTEESRIPEYLDTLNTGLFIRVLQSETDRRVTDARKAFDAKPPAPDQTQPPVPPTDSNSQYAALEKKFLKLENDRKTDGFKSRLDSRMSAEKIPAAFARGLSLENEEDIETAVNAAKTEWQSIQQGQIDQKVQDTHQPGAGSPPAGAAGAKDIAAAVQKFVESQRPKKSN